MCVYGAIAIYVLNWLRANCICWIWLQSKCRTHQLIPFFNVHFIPFGVCSRSFRLRTNTQWNQPKTIDTESIMKHKRIQTVLGNSHADGVHRLSISASRIPSTKWCSDRSVHQNRFFFSSKCIEFCNFVIPNLDAARSRNQIGRSRATAWGIRISVPRHLTAARTKNHFVVVDVWRVRRHQTASRSTRHERVSGKNCRRCFSG